MPRPGETFPIVDFLANLPAAAVAGSCFASDRRGTNQYIYVLVPTSASTATFWRMSVNAKSIQQLTSPTLGAASVIGAATALAYDESMGRVWMFTPESANGGVGLEWARFQYYTIATNTWTAQTVAGLGLGAQWATDANLCHPCTSLADLAVGADDIIWLNGDGGAIGGAAPSRIAFFTISTNTWAVAAGLGPRAGAPAAGSCLQWHPSREGALYSLRGGGSNAMDVYTVATNTWGVTNLLPATETFAAGTETWPMIGNLGAESWCLVAQAGRIKLLRLGAVAGNSPIAPLCEIDGVDGAAHLGNGMTSFSVGEKRYVAIRPHSGTAVQRIRLVL